MSYMLFYFQAMFLRVETRMVVLSVAGQAVVSAEPVARFWWAFITWDFLQNYETQLVLEGHSAE